MGDGTRLKMVFVEAYQCPGLSQLVIFVAGVKFVQHCGREGKGEG